jgi:hypothetical protein
MRCERQRQSNSQLWRFGIVTKPGGFEPDCNRLQTCAVKPYSLLFADAGSIRRSLSCRAVEGDITMIPLNVTTLTCLIEVTIPTREHRYAPGAHRVPCHYPGLSATAVHQNVNILIAQYRVLPTWDGTLFSLTANVCDLYAIVLQSFLYSAISIIFRASLNRHAMVMKCCKTQRQRPAATVPFTNLSVAYARSNHRFSLQKFITA